MQRVAMMRAAQYLGHIFILPETTNAQTFQFFVRSDNIFGQKARYSRSAKDKNSSSKE
jgi:hypothetical protein